MNVYHMPKNHGTDIPRQCVVLQVTPKDKWNKEDGKVKAKDFGGGCGIAFEMRDGKGTRVKVFRFVSIREFWEWLDSYQSPKRTLWVFGADLGRTLTYLDWWHEILNGRYRVGEVQPEDAPGLIRGKKPFRGKMVVDGYPFYAYTLGKRGRVKWIDFWNYLPHSIETIRKLFCICEPPHEKDVGLFSKYEVQSMDDAYIIMYALIGLLKNWEQENCGVWQATAAQLALTSFRHMLPDKSKGEPGDTITLDQKYNWVDLEKQSYYGGQTEPFFVGNLEYSPVTGKTTFNGSKIVTDPNRMGPFYRVDVNGLYPYVMSTGIYPLKRFRQYHSVTPGKLMAMCKAQPCIANVRVESYTMEHIKKHNDRQWHLKGNFWTTLAGPELEWALRNECVKEVRLVQTYVGGNPFKKWIDHWWFIRMNSSGAAFAAQNAFAKLILTSLSGKFAQHGKRWKDMPEAQVLQDWGIRHIVRVGGPETETVSEKWRFIARHPQLEVEGDPPWYYFPALSSFITSYGRELMRSVRESLPSRSVLYQGVDSLILTREGYNALAHSVRINPIQIGSWKLQDKLNRIRILGPNYYKMDDQWVRSGVMCQYEFDHGPEFYTYMTESVHSILTSEPNATVIERWSEVTDEGINLRKTVNDEGTCLYMYMQNNQVYPDFSSLPS